MSVSVAIIKKLEEVEPHLRSVLIALLEEIERQREETVTKSEFNELKEIVRELAEAQKRTEQRLEELAEAQKQLTIAVQETQKELKELVKEHAKTRTELGGLSHSVGYMLENEAYKHLPTLLKKEFGIEVEETLVRRFVTDRNGRAIEMNIIGEGRQNGLKVLIVGEAKSQLSKKKISTFLRKKVRPLEGTFEGELFPILVTHMISEPDVEDYAREKNIRRIYYSYEFD